MSDTVMVIEDTRTVRQFEELILRQAGYRVVSCDRGDDGLVEARRVLPDVVLLDIELPGIDGVECCRRIKEDPATKFLRVVMVTSQDNRERVRQAFGAGCDGYVTKPVDRDELLSKVSSLMKLANARKAMRGLLG